MNLRTSNLVLLLGSCLLSGTALARAPDDFEEAYARPTQIESPERFQAELKVGRYSPNIDGFYDRFFGGGGALMIAAELDVNIVRIPYVGTVGAGGGWGWARARGNTVNASGQNTEEAAALILYPLSALGVLRVDVLVRHLNIPLMLTGKIGWDVVRWKSEVGSSTEASGISHGLRWAGQAALDLNFLEPKAARNLDEEWGINRTFLLFEYYGTRAEGKSLPLQDRNFLFGLGFGF